MDTGRYAIFITPTIEGDVRDIVVNRWVKYQNDGYPGGDPGMIPLLKQIARFKDVAMVHHCTGHPGSSRTAYFIAGIVGDTGCAVLTTLKDSVEAVLGEYSALLSVRPSASTILADAQRTKHYYGLFGPVFPRVGFYIRQLPLYLLGLPPHRVYRKGGRPAISRRRMKVKMARLTQDDFDSFWIKVAETFQDSMRKL